MQAESRKQVLDIIHKGAIYLALLLGASFLLSMGAHLHWALDLFSHFVIQYFIGGVILAFTLAAFREAVLAGMCALVCIVSFVAIQANSAPAPEVQAETVLKVLHYNRKYTLSDHSDLAAYILDKQPDVAVIQEARETHVTMAETLRGDYPHQIQEPRLNAFGMVILSKLPFKEQRVRDFERIALDNFQVRFVVEPATGHEVAIYAIHPIPPMGAAAQKQRNNELFITAEHVKNEDTANVIMLGDWNITPFSPHFQSALTTSGLKNEHTQFPMFPTWPSFHGLPIFQIPIDHILHKGDLQLVEKKRGSAMGSDHYPVIASYAFSAQD